jgi:threonine dehydratase
MKDGLNPVETRILVKGLTKQEQQFDKVTAVGFAAMKLKLVVEPGGAAALAAVLSGAFDAKGKTLAIVLSGGNIDPEMLTRCLDAMPSP